MADAELIDALHRRWTEKHAQWLQKQERKRARLNGDVDMACGKKGRKGRGGGKRK